jgi:hypothetical protein
MTIWQARICLAQAFNELLQGLYVCFIQRDNDTSQGFNGKGWVSSQVVQGEELSAEDSHLFETRHYICSCLLTQCIHEKCRDLITCNAESFKRQVPEIAKVFDTVLDIACHWRPRIECAAKKGDREGKEGHDEIGPIFSHRVKGIMMEYSLGESEDGLVEISLIMGHLVASQLGLG